MASGFDMALAQSKVNAGLIAGVGISSLNDNNYGANKLNIHIGLPVNFNINKKLDFQTTLQLATMGYSSSFYKPSERLKLYYLDIIPVIKYAPFKIFFLEGGFYAGVLLNSNYRYLAYSNDYYGEPDISNVVNKYDYGFTGGMGCQFDNGIGFKFSVLYGLQNVFNSNISDTLVGYYGHPYVIPSDANGSNMVISTSFYYLFGKNMKVEKQ